MKLKINNSSINDLAKTFMIDLDKELFIKDKQKAINFDFGDLYLKDEYHITLIGNFVGNEIYCILNENKIDVDNFYLELKNKIEELILNLKIEIQNEYHLLNKEYNREKFEVRYSIIQIIKTNIIKETYDFIENNYNIKLNLSLPESHITLYKQKENVGIGLNERGDLDKYSIKKTNSLNFFTN
jgi:hypothetical protein